MTRDAWQVAVDQLLQGRSFDDVLVHSTVAGIDVQPLYDRAPPESASARGRIDPARVEFGWDVRQLHDATLGPVNDDILDDLQNGVTSIELAVATRADLERALDGVRLDLAPVALAPHADAPRVEALIEVARSRGAPLAGGSLLGLDPIGEWARQGAAVDPTVDIARIAGELRGSGLRTCTVDVVRYAEAGASDIQVLAWATATGVAYLRLLVDGGLDVDEAASAIGFRLPVTPDQFAAMALLRAARTMWSRVLVASGASAGAVRQYQHAVTSGAAFSRRDPLVNLLRGTAAALAAGIGGADAVSVLPYDVTVGGPSRRARRMARNTQLLLLEESHVSRTTDPGGGSYYVESLTHELGARAWEMFQAVETQGGLPPSFADGSTREAIDRTWHARLDAVRTRDEGLVGVSRFAQLDEAPSSGPEPAVAGLPMRRPARVFEELHDRADRHTARTGGRPTVHIAALGSEATHAERTTWVRDLLVVGGIATEGGTGDGAGSPIAAQASFAAGGRSIAVISSSDETYARRAPATTMALREAGAQVVALVGDPGPQRDELERAGVEAFWHPGVDVVDVLAGVHRTLGIDDDGAETD